MSGTQIHSKIKTFGTRLDPTIQNDGLRTYSGKKFLSNLKCQSKNNILTTLLTLWKSVEEDFGETRNLLKLPREVSVLDHPSSQKLILDTCGGCLPALDNNRRFTPLMSLSDVIGTKAEPTLSRKECIYRFYVVRSGV